MSCNIIIIIIIIIMIIIIIIIDAVIGVDAVFVLVIK